MRGPSGIQPELLLVAGDELRRWTLPLWRRRAHQVHGQKARRLLEAALVERGWRKIDLVKADAARPISRGERGQRQAGLVESVAESVARGFAAKAVLRAARDGDLRQVNRAFPQRRRRVNAEALQVRRLPTGSNLFVMAPGRHVELPLLESHAHLRAKKLYKRQELLHWTNPCLRHCFEAGGVERCWAGNVEAVPEVKLDHKLVPGGSRDPCEDYVRVPHLERGGSAGGHPVCAKTLMMTDGNGVAFGRQLPSEKDIVPLPLILWIFPQLQLLDIHLNERFHLQQRPEDVSE